MTTLIGNRTKDISGQKFGRWSVVSPAGKNKFRQSVWVCECECGARKTIATAALTTGQTLSCGCYHRDAVSKHGLSKTHEYRCWTSMIARCTRESSNRFKMYSGRGITVCDEWMSFEGFLKDMGTAPAESMQVERIDNDAGYCKENCRWATAKEQARNRRTSLFIEYKGESKTLAEWCELLGLNYKTTWERIRQKGVPVEIAFT